MTFDEKYDIITSTLLGLAIERKTVSIQIFCNLLKINDVTFSIYSNRNASSSIYFYLGDISQECIDEKIPNITTLIECKKIMPFYRLDEIFDNFNDLSKKEQFEKYKNIQKEVFNFDWNEYLKNSGMEILKSESGNTLELNANYDSTTIKKLDAIDKEIRISIPQNIKELVFIRVQKERGCVECEGGNCKNRLSFNRKDGTIYLEFHHKNEVYKGGSHHPENLLVLYPNCHREIHFG